jgi:hypothetical protein
MHRVAIALIALLFAVGAMAETPPADPILATLKDWRGWVMKDVEYRSCPFLATQAPGDESTYLCAWPARLELDAQAGGATFKQRWQVETAGWIPLPGDAEQWPQDVSVDGRPAVVLLREDAPSVWLTPGKVEVRGRIPWEHRPQQLRVPEQVGLIALHVDGKAVEPLERSADQLTLGRGEVAEPEADALSLRVFRKLDDGVPAELTTRIEFDVSGQAREETFSPVLPDAFVPLALQGDLPARLDPDGKLHVQVQPGTWNITLTARSTSPLTKVSVKLGEEPWPQQEIWSYSAQSALRVSNANAATPIDPAQAGVPAEWRSLPAFAFGPDGVLTVEERSRGLANDEANRLNLSREAWLDFAGNSLFAKDRIGGRMQKDWRLDVAAPYRLERAEADGQGLLVTRGAATNESGVELRNPQVNLSAGLRIDASGGRLPIAGWKQAFDSVSMNLHLPYGYRLLAAPGADAAMGSWISLWSLMDVFVVAIAGLLALRLLGFAGGAIALIYLLLSYHEPEAPRWALVFVCAFALLLRALPLGKLKTAALWLSRVALVALVLLTLPFLADQVRYALYPQLERVSSYSTYDAYGMAGKDAGYALKTAEPMPQAPPPPPISAPMPNDVPMEEVQQAATNAAPASRDVLRAMASPKLAMDKLEKSAMGGNGRAMQGGLISQRYASNAVIQAGGGEPAWRYGSTYNLSWSGPVLADQSVRLVIAPPWFTRALRAVMLLLLLLTAANLARRLFAAGPDTSRWAWRGVAGLLLSAMCGAQLSAPVQAADYPSQELLAQLRERLQEAPKCAPSCANLARAQVRVAGDRVHASLDLALGERVAIPLPEADAALVLDSARLDGAEIDAIAHHEEMLWVPAGRGVHRLDLDFRVLDTDHLALKFPLKPARIETTLEGWQAGGVSEQRLLSDTLTLTRERREQTDANTPGRSVAQQFPPYVRITRNVLMELEWSISSQATRLAPQQGGFSTRSDLLAGEQVLTPGVKTEEGKVLLSFDADQPELNWNSRLERGDTLTLTAPPLADRAEVWRVTSSPMWHTQFSGVPEVQSQESQGGYWTHEFHPLPGEVLTVKVTRPEAVEGRSFAIDSVSVVSNAGTRALDTTLTLALRSTQGGEHVLALPDGAEVLSVNKNGQFLNLRPREGKLSLPLTPGMQSFQLQLRQSQELSMMTRTPAFDLGVPAANLSLQLQLPADRWVLFVTGPAVGPAVLYWGELIVMILVAWALTRLRRTPLRLHHWLLLGFGFSTFSWVALLLVIAWLFALDWRERWAGPKNDGIFNLAQIGMALLTLLALLCLIASIPFGLLGQPDMHIAGNGSSAFQLRWFTDQVTQVSPTGSAVTLPLWFYKLTMLAWALWLANALIGWLRWGFAAWSATGYWRNSPRKAAAVAGPVAVETKPDA